MLWLLKTILGTGYTSCNWIYLWNYQGRIYCIVLKKERTVTHEITASKTCKTTEHELWQAGNTLLRNIWRQIWYTRSWNFSQYYSRDQKYWNKYNLFRNNIGIEAVIVIQRVYTAEKKACIFKKGISNETHINTKNIISGWWWFLFFWTKREWKY